MTRLLAIAALLALAPAAGAGAPAVPGAVPMVRECWIALPPPGVRVAAGYFELSNPGAAEVRVVAVKVAGFGAAEMHESVHEGMRMSMRRHESVTVAAGATLRFAPGGLHLMLFRALAPLAAGQQHAIELTLADGRTLSASAEVRDGRAVAPADPHASH